MHVLITGAAGMIGRKLLDRLAKDGSLNGKPIDKLTLTDMVRAGGAAGFRGKVDSARPPTFPRRASPKNWSRSGPT